MNAIDPNITAQIRRGDELRREGRVEEAISAYEAAARETEVPHAYACLKLARVLFEHGITQDAAVWLRAIVDSTDRFTAWQSAASLLSRLAANDLPQCRRMARVAVLGSYTTAQYTSMLRLAALRCNIAIDTYECDYGQYRQDILNPQSRLYEFSPDVVVLTVHAGELALPNYAENHAPAIQDELLRWKTLWDVLSMRSSAHIIQHNFVSPLENAFGHLASRLPGSRAAMIDTLNVMLAESLPANVSMVDCDRLAARLGKQRWFDDRYWLLSRQAVSLEALPMLARHTAAVLAARLGLSKKCLVLDLDNTMWGGVIGEDGLGGIRLGAGVDGEAFVAFQRVVKSLGERGVILAVCSKNNDADAREPFLKHPDMQLKLDDIAIFVANWQPKPENLKFIAQSLNIGLDSMVFLDDNAAEREIVRQQTPEVECIVLPNDPVGYARTLTDYLGFELSSFTAEDAAKTEQYRARAQAAALQAVAGSLEEFHTSLEMRAEVAPFDELHLPRIEQLLGKTNQFNLTTRRHNVQQLRRFMSDPNCIHLYLKLRDRFADHGLVSVVIAFRRGTVVDIDTWLMSCRVIGRTVENALLHELCIAAERRGCLTIQGTYVPTAKNAMVKDVFDRYEFALIEDRDGTTTWQYDLASRGPVGSTAIQIDEGKERAAHDAA